MSKDRWTETLLEAAYRPRKIYEYFVTGRGMFPYDMLRYDHCWPADGDNAVKLDSNERNFRVVRSIKMHSYKEPTVDRWSSFVWSVGTENLSQ